MDPTTLATSGLIRLLIFLSGCATLSWEVLWQMKSTLAIGVSAFGTAITLAVMMGGMSFGSLLIQRFIQHYSNQHLLRLYGLMEFCIGLSGFFLVPAFELLEKVDTWTYTTTFFPTSFIQIFGIVIILSIPSFCIGATLPLFGIIAHTYNSSVSKLYSSNILGAAIGVLFIAFVLIPFVGVYNTIKITAMINVLIAGCFCLLSVSAHTSYFIKSKEKQSQLIPNRTIWIVAITGFVTFTLEIAWFRSFEAVFQNTTDIFAVLLACVLIALGLAAKKVSQLKQKKKSLHTQLAIAGILIFLTTPLIERFDFIFTYPHLLALQQNHTLTFVNNYSWLLNSHTLVVNWVGVILYFLRIVMIFGLCYVVIVPTVSFIGIALPWLLDEYDAPTQLSKLYAINTLAAILGVVVAAWVLLPTIGFAKTAWIAGACVITASILLAAQSQRYFIGILALCAFCIAFSFETGIGKIRAQGLIANVELLPAKVIASAEAPQATISVIEYQDGARALLINSACASGEAGTHSRPGFHYLPWMGRLPMILHPHPKNVLIIGFGVGQTANAVRKENPTSIDIVDIHRKVFQLAHHFKSNENVLHDARVTPIVMDGRAYLRRTQKHYDVITLEPMPPITSGMNALYAQAFYVAARDKLTEIGVIAQWLPFNLLAPHYAASIAKTFTSVFPNAVLWMDPIAKNGILLGTKNNQSIFTLLSRSNSRDISSAAIQQNIILDTKALAKYGAYGEIITDDNQLLAYGKVLYANLGLMKQNLMVLQKYQKGENTIP